MNRIKKIINKETLPYISLFFIMFAINILKGNGYSDDGWFEIVLNGELIPGINSFFSYIKWRYISWSSRLIIETFLILFTSKYMLLWKFLDAIMYSVLAFGINKVFTKNSDKNKVNIRWITVFLILLISQKLFSTAGWVATSLNYLWPLALGILCLNPIKNCIEGKKNKWFEYPIYILMLLYAANAEQICLILVTVYTIFTIYFLIKKKINPLIIIMLVVSILSLVFIVTCPGNTSRNRTEIVAYFGDFEMLSIIDKLVISIISTMQYYVFSFNPIYVVFTFLVMINIFKKYDNIIYKTIAIVPFIMGVAFNVGENITGALFPELIEQFSSFQINTVETWINMRNFNILANYIPLILCIINFGFMMISIYLVFGNRLKSVIAILVLGAGICSRLMMGFMPSIFVSGNRTQLTFIITMIVLSIMILDDESENSIMKAKNILLLPSFLAILNSVYLSLILR